VTTVLDTDVLSELRLPNPNPNVTAWFAAQPAADLAIASFSVAEIEYGIARIPQSGLLATQLTGWLNSIVGTQLVLPLDAAAARIFGRLLAVPALRNLIISSPPQARKPRFAGDLVIAATAVAHQAGVATRNLSDFRLIAQHCPGLVGIDPWTQKAF
jgi:toxin FitB